MKRVIERFELEGYRAAFAVRPGARLECLTCHAEAPAGAVELHGKSRIDVGTDPGDQAVVAALACPECGARGTTTIPYGPSAGPDDAEVLSALSHDKIRGGMFHRLFRPDEDGAR